MMYELSPILQTETQPDARLRCTHTVTLDGVRYGCQRNNLHGGAHDAHTKHRTDGALVRW